ncbi:MAG: cupin domain-containing protein [Candidatus Nanopelagicales bacterium]
METVEITKLAQEYLELAAATSSGRHSHTLYGGHGHVLRQTLMALTSGNGLSEHDNAGEATLQVIMGRLSLNTSVESIECGVGDLLVVPNVLHSVTALADSAFLLTVVVPQQ